MHAMTVKWNELKQKTKFYEGGGGGFPPPPPPGPYMVNEPIFPGSTVSWNRSSAVSRNQFSTFAPKLNFPTGESKKK
mgnify:CR=1 FL=1